MGRPLTATGKQRGATRAAPDDVAPIPRPLDAARSGGAPQ